MSILKPILNKDSETSWEKAKEVAGVLGQPHRLFTQCVRDLRGIPEGSSRKKMLESSAVITLFRSESFKTVIYYAAKALYGEDVGKKPMNGGDLIQLFAPDELASVVAATHLHRLTGKKVSPKIWNDVVEEVNFQMQTGILVGAAVPAVSRAVGLLMGAVRTIAFSLVASSDESKFRAFRRELVRQDKLFDVAGELQTWGCHHLQVAALVVQSLGYGIGPATGIAASEMPAADDGPIAFQWYAARRWIESMLEEERAPSEFPAESKFGLNDLNKLGRLQGEVDNLYAQESSICWITQKRGTLDKAIIRQLRSFYNDPTEGLAVTGMVGAKSETEAEEIVAQVFE
ncbi:MAG: hypothetical protein RL417_1020 [Pseudomonadota bacterium]|jgi:hypothetical protein